MSLATTRPSPIEALPFLPDLLAELAEWEARHALEIQKTFLFVHPETHRLYYAVIGTSWAHDMDNLLLDEVAEFSARVRRSPRYPGIDFDGEYFLREGRWEFQDPARGLTEIRRDG